DDDGDDDDDNDDDRKSKRTRVSASASAAADEEVAKYATGHALRAGLPKSLLPLPSSLQSDLVAPAQGSQSAVATAAMALVDSLEQSEDIRKLRRVLSSQFLSAISLIIETELILLCIIPLNVHPIVKPLFTNTFVPEHVSCLSSASS